jgi:enoyl-CoA hydratase/carnithine racemase
MIKPVLFELHSCENNKQIAVATLNSPRTLNALNLTMVDLLLNQLRLWRDDPDVVMVLIKGAGEKGFCAGGDVKDLYYRLQEDSSRCQHQVAEFFSQEYQLDYLIHTFNKPVMILGSGVVMGGGMGLFMGASHRIVDQSSQMAMPEICIGLFPDVGATWFLSRLAPEVGLFLGLTGAAINAADAKYLGIADFFISQEQQEQLLEKLLSLAWGDTIALNHEKLSTFLNQVETLCKNQLPKSVIRSHQELLKAVVKPEDFFGTVENILSVKHDSQFIIQAQANLAYGSPLSAAIIYRQLMLGRKLTLEQCFQMELTLAIKCVQFGEFCEGVRALLVDKDRQPNWQYKDINTIEPARLDWFFDSEWPEGEHPLASIAS